MRTFLTLLACLLLAAGSGAGQGAAELAQLAPAAGPLPQTAPLEWPEEDLSGRMMDGAHRFVEDQIARTLARLERFWTYDRSSPAACNKSIQDNRNRLCAKSSVLSIPG